MRIDLRLSIVAMLVVLPQLARADTIYKCVQAGGQISFSSRPCDAKATLARELAVPPPEADEVSAVRLAQERARLRLADKQFARRQAARNDAWASGGGSQIANVPKTVSKAARQESERQEAARLNAARIGNCSMRRPEANCL
jgi:hypothetical protein